MGCLTDSEDRVFKKGERGETLFYLDRLWWWGNKPLVIESDEQLRRVHKKHLWVWRILRLFNWVVMCGMIGFLIMIPESTVKTLTIIAWLPVMLAVFWLVKRMVFWPEVRELKRHPRRETFRDYYRQVAEESSKAQLVRGLIIWMLLGVLVVAWLAFRFSGTPSGQVLGIICAVHFGVLGIVWGFALKFKAGDT